MSSSLRHRFQCPLGQIGIGNGPVCNTSVTGGSGDCSAAIGRPLSISSPKFGAAEIGYTIPIGVEEDYGREQ